MPKLRVSLPTKWWSRFIWVFVSYILATDFLPNLLLLIINCSGYLPYSDRPGPGWQMPHWPARQELIFFFGFAVYLGTFSAIYATGQTLLAFIYGVSSLPKWIIRISGAITGFIAAGLLMAGAGWMIAIAPIGVYIAAGCGFLWGAFIMPCLVVPREQRLPLLARIVLPVMFSVAAIFYLIYPLLPKTPVAPITFELNRVTSGTTPVRADTTPYLKPETQEEINALNLHGEMHGGIQSTQGTTSNDVDVVVLALQPIDREYKLDIPAQGHVVYVLSGDKLTPHPALGKKEKQHILLEPGDDPVYDGGKIKVGNEGDFAPFTWSPTIRR